MGTPIVGLKIHVDVDVDVDVDNSRWLEHGIKQIR